MISRRTTAVAAALGLVTASVLTGCSTGGGASTSSGAKSIRVADYYTDEPAKSIIGSMLDACGAAAGVRIDREGVPSSDYLSKVLQQSSSRTLPDIQMLDAQDLPTISSTGALEPVTDRGVSPDAVGGPAQKLGTVDGDVYGLAPTLGTIVMFTNKDLLQKAGVAVPKTWSDLQAAAKKLTSGSRYGIAFSAKNNAEGTYAYLPLLWSAGGSEKDLTSDAAESALQLEVDLVSSGSASKSVVQWGNSDVGDQFLAGKAAIAIVSATQMSKFDADSSLHYEISTPPVPSAGDTAVAPLGGEVWTLPRTGDSAREAKAAQVLKCIVSDKNQLSLAVKRRVVPAAPSLDADYLKQLPTLGAYVDTVNHGRSRTALLGKQWPATNAAIWTAVQSAVTGQQTVSAALAAAAK